MNKNYPFVLSSLFLVLTLNAGVSVHSQTSRSVAREEATAPRALSTCGKRVDALQKQIYKALYASYENFQYLKLSRPGLLGLVDLKKRKITKIYREIMEDMLLESDPEILCKSGELYYEETPDAVTGAGRQPTPKGYLLKLKSRLNDLYDMLNANIDNMRLDRKQFELLLSSEIHPAYAQLKRELETQKANFRLRFDP